MKHNEVEALAFQPGEAKALPATLSKTRHLTLTLIDLDASRGTATFELHNPDAQADEVVSGLIEGNVDSVEASNALRDRLHLPEKAVPVDTSTMAVETLDCRLHEKLQIGDRTWTVAAIEAGGVTLTAGRDHEAHNALNELEDAEFSPAATEVAMDLNAVDREL